MSTLFGVSLMIIVILIYNYRISRDYILLDARKDALNLTELTVNQTENILNTIERSPEELAFYINKSGDVEKANAFLKTTIERFPIIKGACIAFAPVEKNGKLFYNAPYFFRRNDTLLSKNLSDNNYEYWNKVWYTLPMQLNRAVWSEPYFDEGGADVMMSTYSVPFYLDNDSIPEGIITVDLSLSQLQKLVESIRIYDEGFAFLLSSQGNVITHPKINLNNEGVIINVTDSIRNPEMLKLVRRMLNGEKDFVSLEGYSRGDHSKDWVSFAQIPSNKWSIALVFHESDLYDEIEALTYKLIYIGIAGVILIALIIFLIARNITKPLIELVKALREVGKGHLNIKIPSMRSRDEIGLLGESFADMQDELKKYIENLRETTAEKEKIESEINIASRIQRDMLPLPYQESGDMQDIKLDAYLLPALQIGGDLYDYVKHPDGSLFFVIGDVSGKGVPASLFMSRTITLFRTIARIRNKVSEIASEINKELCVNNDTAMFVTMFIGKIEPGKDVLSYCNAGHNLPLTYSNGRIAYLEGTSGMPVGLFEETEYYDRSIGFSKGELILLYTDGITEAENASGDFYGEEKLLNCFEHSVSSSSLIGEITADVKAFVNDYLQSDDITLMVVRR